MQDVFESLSQKSHIWMYVHVNMIKRLLKLGSTDCQLLSVISFLKYVQQRKTGNIQTIWGMTCSTTVTILTYVILKYTHSIYSNIVCYFINGSVLGEMFCCGKTRNRISPPSVYQSGPWSPPHTCLLFLSTVDRQEQRQNNISLSMVEIQIRALTCSCTHAHNVSTHHHQLRITIEPWAMKPLPTRSDRQKGRWHKRGEVVAWPGNKLCCDANHDRLDRTKQMHVLLKQSCHVGSLACCNAACLCLGRNVVNRKNVLQVSTGCWFYI